MTGTAGCVAISAARKEHLEKIAEAWEAYQASGRYVTAEKADAWLARLEAGEDVEPPECDE
jgi:predicted transcriptional regulator